SEAGGEGVGDRFGGFGGCVWEVGRRGGRDAGATLGGNAPRGDHGRGGGGAGLAGEAGGPGQRTAEVHFAPGGYGGAITPGAGGSPAGRADRSGESIHLHGGGVSRGDPRAVAGVFGCADSRRARGARHGQRDRIRRGGAGQGG